MLILALLASEFGLGATSESVAMRWVGEYFDRRQGGFYLRIDLDDGLAEIGDLRVELAHEQTGDRLKFMQHIDNPKLPPKEIWKVRAGSYRISRIWLTDNSGKLWEARAPRVPRFFVKDQSISNLGLLKVNRGKPTGRLNIHFEPRPDLFHDKSSQRESSVAFIIHGFTGRIETVVGGQKVYDGVSQQLFNREANLRVGYKTQMQVGIYYVLNLFKHNHLTKQFIKVIEADEIGLRECYMASLQDQPDMQGVVKFSFNLSRQSKVMSSLRQTGGSISDPKLIECLYYRLGALNFQARDNIVGEVSLQFTTKR